MKPGRKRKLVDDVCSEWRVSIRKACAALEFDRSTYHYKILSLRSGRPRKFGSGRSVMSASDTATAVFMSCCVARDGVTGRTRRVASIAS
jgi:hypothetical protein